MIPTLTRLGLLVAGNRLVVAAVQGRRVQTFVVEAEQPGVALRAELDARRLAARTVAVGLSRSAVTVKPIDFPLLNGNMREMVRFELDRHLPFPADDAAFDFLPLPADKGSPAGDARRVLVAGMDRRVVDGVLRIADEARLRPTSVTVAAHDLLALVRPDRSQRVAWIHRSPLGADLLFLAGGRLVLSRSIGATGDEELAEEIRRSFPVLRWRGCDAIWISGDGDTAGPALATFEAPVSAPPWTRQAEPLRVERPEVPAGLSELALAVAVRRGARPLDLIPEERKPRRITRGQWVTAALLVVTIGVGLAALLYPGYRANRYLAATNAKIDALTPQVRAVEGVQKELERRRQLLASIESLATNALRPLPMLRELTDLVPQDAWVTSLSFDTKGIEMSGQASSASTLIPLLENSNRLERVEFSSPVTKGRDKEQFRIRATWEAANRRPDAAAVQAPGSPAARAPGRRPPTRPGAGTGNTQAPGRGGEGASR